MSQYYANNGKFYYPDFGPGRTKQAFKDECDINNIVYRFSKTRQLDHLTKYEPIYGDFADMPDLLEAQERIAAGQKVFNDLPAEIRKEFNQDAGQFFKFVNDPANKDQLRNILPALAKPGRQRVANRTPAELAAEGVPVVNPAPSAEAPPTAPESS